MKKITRLISKLALILIMMLSSFVIGPTENVLALANDPTDSNRVTVDKEAKLVDGAVNTWDITLDVKSLNKQSQKTTNVVLVLDVSGSMSGYMRDLRDSAKAFVDVFRTNPNVRISLVSFDTEPRNYPNAGGNGVQYATTSGQKDELKDTIEGLRTRSWNNQYTNTQGGIYYGMLSLDAADVADDSVMILFSDGAPNRSYRFRNGVYEYGGDIVSTQDSFAAGKDAANWTKGKGHKIYSIGFNVNNQTRTFLEEVSSGTGYYHAATSSDLGTVFAGIAGQISTDYGIENAQVIDIIAPGFTVVSALTPNVGTATQSENTITWNIGKMEGAGIKNATLTYRVEIIPSILDVTPNGKLYPTNTSAILTDKSNTGFTPITFPVPEVDPVFVHVDKRLIDENNQVIVDTDRIFDVKLSHTNGYDENTQVKAGQRVTLTTLRKVDNGYVVLETGSNDGTVNDADFSDYTIRYLIGGVETDKFNVITKTNSVEDAMDDIYVVVENKYTIPMTTITATKQWEGGDPENRPDIEFQLYRKVGNGTPETVGPSVILDGTETPAWNYTWNNLPAKTPQGKNYTYYVDEVDVPEFYEKIVVDNLKIKNKFVPGITSVVAQKIWEGGVANNRPEVSFQLYQQVGNETPVMIGSPVTLDGTETTPWHVTFTGLITHRQSDGKLYKYFVREVNVPENFKADDVDDLVVTNTYVSPKIDITGNKVWVNGPQDRPTIQLQLYRNGVAHLAPVTLENGQLVYTWTGLDKTDFNGVDYTYTVDELNVPENYSKSIDGLTITNTYGSPKITVYGYKAWVGGPEVKPTIQLQLYRDEVAYGSPVTLTNGNTSFAWTDLDKTDSNGNIYTYRVDEVAVPDNYEKSISQDGFTVTNTYVSPKRDITGTKVWVGGPSDKPTIELQLFRDGVEFGLPVELLSGETTHTWTGLDKTDKYGVDYVYTVDEVNVPDNYEKSVVGFVVTNSYVSPKIEITGTKLWFGGLEDRPTIELQLFRDGVEFGDPVELVSGETTYTWTELDKTDLSGVDYVYTIDEVEVPENYTKSISQNGLIVSNTYVSPKIDIIGTKVWIDGPEDRPIIELQLFRDGEAFGEPVELTEGMLSHTWSDLDKTDFDGIEYVYTVDEVNVPENYEKSVDGFIVTNSYVSPKIDITGTKVWVNGPDEKPTIELQLFRDGEAFGEPVELVDGVTSYTWTDLDKTDAMGVDYVYTVDEVEVVENFEKTVEGLVVTNTYVSPLIDITMTKVWVGEIEEFPTIQIQLFRNGVAFGAPIELVDGATSATWTDLEQTDENGVDYVYTIDEVEIPTGYFRIIDGLTITNVLIELPDTGGEEPEKPIIKLPDTGGMNSQMFMMFGAGVTLVGALIAIVKRKEDEEE